MNKRYPPFDNRERWASMGFSKVGELPSSVARATYHLIQANHAHPTSSVAAVIGAPARKSSQKLTCTSGRALSTTMILATLPVIVRLPASVEAIASTSQAVCGLENPGTSDLSSITAGTLLTILLRTPTAIVNTATCCRFQCSATSSRFCLCGTRHRMEYGPVEEQPNQRDGTQVPKEVAILNPGERPDQHVLRVAGDRRDAADV